MGENARFKNGHARVKTRVLKTIACRKGFFGPLLSNVRQPVGAFKKRTCQKMLLNIPMQCNAGTACVSECVLKTLLCRGLRVRPSNVGSQFGLFHPD